MKPEKIGRALTSWFRVLPDFIIIGGQKCGTSSLYRYLIQHPCVAPARKKELHFFDYDFRKGRLSYRACFSPVWSRWFALSRGRQFATGEATPYYMFHPHVPRRILQTVPQVRLIALLRNPVDRAYSHYQSQFRRGREKLPFAEAIQKETERLRDETELMLVDEHYRSTVHQRKSYLSRGVYVDALKAWLSLFPRQQLLVLKSENFFADTSGTLERVLNFLKLPSFKIRDLRPYNQRSYQQMSPATRKQLVDYFAPHNERLRELLGENFGWDR